MTDLLRRAAERGDAAEFRLFYETSAPRTKSYVLARGAAAAAAEEITQEILLDAWKRSAPQPELAALAALQLFESARNTMIDRQRKAFAWQALLPTRRDPAPLASTRATLQRAIGALPGPELEVLRLVYLEGLAPGLAADRLDLPHATVRSRLRLAYQKLREAVRAVRRGSVFPSAKSSDGAIARHPDDSTLMAFAAGSLPEAASAVIAAHASLCPHCQHELGLMETIGHELIERLPPAEMKLGAPVMSLRGLEAEVVSMRDAPVRAAAAAAPGEVPAILQHLVGRELAGVAWRRTGVGTWRFPLPLSKGAGGGLELVKLAPARPTSWHRPDAGSLTLVLQGSFSEASGRYATGDIADLGQSAGQQGLAHAEAGCIGLVARDGKAREKGLLHRFLPRFAGG